MEQTPLQKILTEIERTTGPATRRGSSYELRCPAHPDHEPSLGLTENTEQHALLYCQAGCSAVDVLQAVGLSLRDLYPIRADDRRADPVIATYRYTDEQGELLYEVQRTAAKKFRQRRPDPAKPNSWLYNLNDTRRVLYRLPAAMQAIREGQTIYLPEGEKDVHSLEQDNHVATTSPGGVGKWRPEYTEALRGAHVVVICDRDTNGTGVRHGRNVAFLLQPVAASVTLMQPAIGKDYTDHRTTGLGVDDLEFVPTEIATPVLQPLPGHTGPADGTADEPVSPAGELPTHRIRLTPASAFKIRAVQWVWQDRMPLGELCLIAGREGVGKSTFLAWLAAAVTNGNLPGIYHGEPRAVLYAASEDAWGYTIAPRMLAAGADLTMIYRIDVVDDEGPAGLLLPRDSRHLPEVAESVKAAMLMCDPILSLVDGRINPNQGSELRKALEPLKHAAEAAGLAVPALVHFNKTRDVDVLSMFAGSRAWTEVARSALAIARDDDAEEYTCTVSQVKNNLGRSELPNLLYTIDDVAVEAADGPDAHVGRIRWTGESDTNAGEILARRPPNPNRDGDLGDRTTAVLDWIDDQGHGVSAKDAIDHFTGQINPSNIRAILTRSVQRGHLSRPTGGLYVTRRPDTPDSTTRPETRAHAYVTTPRRNVTPPSDRSLPNQTTLQGGVKGKESVTILHYSERGRGSVAEGVTISCRGCHGPLTVIEEGQLYHPLCQPDLDGSLDVTQEEPPPEEPTT